MKIQEISRNQQSKYEEIIEYLKKDNGYWLDNDKWDFYKNFKHNLDWAKCKKYLDFSVIKNAKIMLELKYSLLYGLKNKYFHPDYVILAFQAFLKKVQKYNSRNNINSLVNIDSNKFKIFLMNIENLTETSANAYMRYVIRLNLYCLIFMMTEKKLKRIYGWLRILKVLKLVLHKQDIAIV